MSVFLLQNLETAVAVGLFSLIWSIALPYVVKN